MPPAHYIEEHTRKIFDVPIYRCTEERYYKEREREEKELISSIGLDPARHAEQISGVQQSLFDSWGPWRYNETVGWLEIKAATSRILGTLYLTNARITKRTRAKRIFCRDKLFEYHIPRNASPTEIYKRLKGALIEHVTATASLRGRFIDFEALDTLGPHIDWSTLVSRKHGTS